MITITGMTCTAGGDFNTVVTGEEKAGPLPGHRQAVLQNRGDRVHLKGFVGGCASGDREEGHSRRGRRVQSPPHSGPSVLALGPWVAAFPSPSLPQPSPTTFDALWALYRGEGAQNEASWYGGGQTGGLTWQASSLGQTFSKC